MLVPLVIALAGLAVGVGAGVALKPAPEEPEAAPCAEGEACAEAADPLAPPAETAEAAAEPVSVVALDKPFVVPVFRDDRVVAMVVVSTAVAIAAAKETEVEAATPRLRDAMLAAMFRHANSGGFDGAFTTGRKMEDLRAALLVAAREVFGATPVSEVLITEIARQDV